MRHMPPTRIPCAVCLVTIESWHDRADEHQYAHPCQHTWEEMWDEWREAVTRRDNQKAADRG